MTKQSQAYLLALTAVLLWSTVATAFKIALSMIDFVSLLFYSTGISFIALFIISLSTGKIRQIRNWKRQDHIRSIWMGFLNPFLYYFVLFKAYSLLPAQEALTLNYSWAVVIVLLSIVILKQRIGLKSIAAVVISFLGVVIIATHGNPLELNFSDELGVVLAVGSSVIWSLFWIFNIKDTREEVTKLLFNFMYGFAFTSLYCIISEEIAIPDLHGFLAVTYIGLFEMGITFVLWLMALKLSETTAQVSNLIYLSPFLSLAFIGLILGEEILSSTFFGLILIVAGIILQQYKRKKNFNR
jgi:drug/metabolite transporter (DMT)-like permease